MAEALINYDDDPDSGIDTESWSFMTLKNYFYQSCLAQYKIGGGINWGLKETSALSRMHREVGAVKVAAMIDWWHSHRDIKLGSSMMALYGSRALVEAEIQKKQEGYSWD